MKHNKLVLNKVTIACLNKVELLAVNGGFSSEINASDCVCITVKEEDKTVTRTNG
ncbi:MAG: hypothetical protein GY765_38775 [bacterium]|nr:hypothetical protein [bacterium]